MLIHILHRLAIALCVAVTVSIVSFLLLHLSGDLATAIPVQLGLDRPMLSQYLDWLGRAVQLDFGRSFYFQADVMQLIAERLPITMKLGSIALLLATVVAIPLGVLAAIY